MTLFERITALEKANDPRAALRGRPSTHAKYMRDTVHPGHGRRPRGRRQARAHRRRRPLAAAEVQQRCCSSSSARSSSYDRRSRRPCTQSAGPSSFPTRDGSRCALRRVGGARRRPVVADPEPSWHGHAMSPRITRSPEDLRGKLVQQVGFLERSADLYDNGYSDQAARLATAIRVLVHDARSKSLLTVLGLRSTLRFADTALHRQAIDEFQHQLLERVRSETGDAIASSPHHDLRPDWSKRVGSLRACWHGCPASMADRPTRRKTLRRGGRRRS